MECSLSVQSQLNGKYIEKREFKVLAQILGFEGSLHPRVLNHLRFANCAWVCCCFYLSTKMLGMKFHVFPLALQNINEVSRTDLVI